ncbi:MAG: hypothetical protein GEV28_00010 [Actinophytocola sp.]|uniref:hypothetical protein n=1 Tax=Actinophytocola sp. TaxID=1872138 RepID=UPI001325749F|nr:hypothetical protein [Actinophytocola sp.]MPZ78860.1 hypothetical protein [Actinophytocola sp.]
MSGDRITLSSEWESDHSVEAVVEDVFAAILARQGHTLRNVRRLEDLYRWRDAVVVAVEERAHSPERLIGPGA